MAVSDKTSALLSANAKKQNRDAKGFARQNKGLAIPTTAVTPGGPAVLKPTAFDVAAAAPVEDMSPTVREAYEQAATTGSSPEIYEVGKNRREIIKQGRFFAVGCAAYGVVGNAIEPLVHWGVSGVSPFVAAGLIAVSTGAGALYLSRRIKSERMAAARSNESFQEAVARETNPEEFANFPYYTPVDYYARFTAQGVKDQESLSGE